MKYHPYTFPRGTLLNVVMPMKKMKCWLLHRHVCHRMYSRTLFTHTESASTVPDGKTLRLRMPLLSRRPYFPAVGGRCFQTFFSSLIFISTSRMTLPATSSINFSASSRLSKHADGPAPEKATPGRYRCFTVFKCCRDRVHRVLYQAFKKNHAILKYRGMTIVLPFPDKKYSVIYADPPWEYKNKNTGGSMNSGASSKYPTMSIEEICNLPVGNICNNDAALFLWATVPLLNHGFDVLAAWGFTYKTSFVWRKIMSRGMGFWFRGQVEVLLLGIRGKVKAFRMQIPNFYQSSVAGMRHSQKPSRFYEIIEDTGLEPRIELFARNRRDGWDSWGNECKNTRRAITLF